MKNQFKILAFAAILLLTLAVCITSAIGANTFLGAANAAPMSLAAIAVLFRPNPTPPPFVPPTPPSQPRYLTFTAQEANCKVGFIGTTKSIDPENPFTTTLQYSTDNGLTWNDYTIVVNPLPGEENLIELANIGDKVMFKGNNSYFSQYLPDNPNGVIVNCICENSVAASGDITSLLNEVGGDVQLTPLTFESLFAYCSTLTSAPNLPSLSLARSCYSSMFEGCSSLTSAPSLPATTLAESCYAFMFKDCSLLLTAHSLPALTLATRCYMNMFENCTSLITAPSLPAQTLSFACYNGMFKGCSSLTTAPNLPATTLAVGCYGSMFLNCTALTTTPSLPALTLVESCYNQMFNGCTSLQSVTCLATSINAQNAVNLWVYNVAQNGTFTKAATMQDWPNGTSGIPTGWTVEDAE